MPLITQAEFARRMGVDPTSVRDALSSGLLTPHVGPGGRRMLEAGEAVEAWRKHADVDQRLRGEGNRSQAGRNEWVDAKAQRERIRVRIEQMELDRLEGTLVSREEIEREFGAMWANVRDDFLSLAARVAPEVFSAKDMSSAIAIFDAAVRETMRRVDTGKRQ